MKSDLTIARTPNLQCPACNVGRRHAQEEVRQFHPFAGHGFNKEQGWSSEELKKSR